MSDNTQVDQVEDNPEGEWGAWFACGEGWRPLIAELHSRLQALSPDYTLSQVKEKFGGLRYYASPADGDEQTATAFSELIRAAEAMSLQTCERCGQPGRLSRRGKQSGWYKTLCPRCAESSTFQQVGDDHEGG